jgi:hypothetical protein
VLQRLNSAMRLIQRTTSEAPQRRYVLHRTGCSQEEYQLLRTLQRGKKLRRQAGSNAHLQTEEQTHGISRAEGPTQLTWMPVIRAQPQEEPNVLCFCSAVRAF